MEHRYENELEDDGRYLGTWSKDDFRLRLWETGTRDEFGKDVLRHELYDDEFAAESATPLFAGEFSLSPMHAIDSLEAAAGILGFLSLQPGDTDDDYFKNYTDEQRRWLETGRPEELSLIVFDIENPPALSPELDPDASALEI